MTDKKLGFGLMRLPLTDKEDNTSIDMDMMKRMVDTFIQRGYTYFDTAYMYHDFESERAVREALVERYDRDCFELATKLPMMSISTKEDQKRIFSEQLIKCGVDYFDNYMLHNINRLYYETAEKLDSFRFIQQKKSEGKIKRIGFSYHDKADFFDKVLTEHPEVDFVQLQLNYLDWNSESIQSRECYEVARKHNVSIIVMEPLKGGTLVNVNEGVKKIFREYDAKAPLSSWAIRFAASLEGIETVLSGMSNYDQLEENTAYMKNFKPFSSEEYALVEKAAEMISKDVVIPCTGCRYCMEKCPQKIPIAEYLALYNSEKQEIKKAFQVQQVYYDNYLKDHSKASDCKECGLCEDVCPQHIEIIKYLKEVAELFEH